MTRAVALTLALTVAASGSGLPMCASLLAQVAEPCAMHEHASGHAGHGPLAPNPPQVVAGHAADDACHGRDGDLGCAAGGTCPAGGVAAPFATAPVVTRGGLAPDVTPAPDATYDSFLSPPAPPPPQG
jgi:hypothetical protein